MKLTNIHFCIDLLVHCKIIMQQFVLVCGDWPECYNHYLCGHIRMFV